uniref:EamA domain-containing protein n=1 Tax=Anopheles quadriannulatus TaxID=34691 RepID=A0A2C9H8L8_ANOQN
MAWSQKQFIFALTMVVTGSINTLSTKWADNIESEGSDGQVRRFVHPFVQACAMFLGEFLCLLAFKAVYYHLRRKNNGSEDRHDLVQGNREFSPFILFVPAMCDMLATSIMYVGLNLTYPSSFQLLRGSVIIFVAILSVAFLNRTLVKREWFGIAFIMVGLVIVGMSDVLSNDNTGSQYTRNNVITGDLLIILAQIITAVQMVYEEYYVTALNIPALQAVGWEGKFLRFFRAGGASAANVLYPRDVSVQQQRARRAGRFARCARPDGQQLSADHSYFGHDCVDCIFQLCRH